MTLAGILFKEMWQRKGTTLLALMTITLAAALYIGMLTLNRTLRQQTVQQMKDLGFNVVILPAATEPDNYLNSEYGDHDMPESYVEKIALSKKATADHFSGRLERRIAWQGQTAILTGILPTRVRDNKAPLGFKTPPAPGEVFCGFAASRGVQVEKDAAGKLILDADGRPRLRPVEILGETFRVAKRLAHTEIKDDMRIYMNIADAQRLLGKPGRIHLIEALGCRCDGDALLAIQDDLEQHLNTGAAPQDRVKAIIPNEPKYLTRERMRQRVEGYAAMMAPAVLLVCLVWIGSLSYMNVRQRRTEIGLLRAVGVGSFSIATLFMAKAGVLGALGGALGFLAGTGAARALGAGTFELAPSAFKPDWLLGVWTIVIAGGMTKLAGGFAAWRAVTLDPAEALREE
jgi:putative ABC transport system permease protein